MGFSVFGDQPKGLTPFEETAPEDRRPSLRLLDHVGKAAIFTIAGPVEKNTKYGLKTAVSCPVVVVLDGKNEPVVYTDSLIFGQAPVDQLKGRAGQTIVALIGSYDSATGGKAPRLEAPTAAALAAAEEYDKAHPQAEGKPPF